MGIARRRARRKACSWKSPPWTAPAARGSWPEMPRASGLSSRITGTRCAGAAPPPPTRSPPPSSPPAAPSTRVEFCDFQCPFCAEERVVLDQLFAAYPREMKVVFRHYPVERRHADAGRAAEASMCAQDQGRFWDMYASMLANQNELDVSGLIRQAG